MTAGRYEEAFNGNIPYKFTRFEYYKFELANYDFKIDILDLSNNNKNL